MLRYLTLPAVPGPTNDAPMAPVEVGMREKLEAQIWADERLEQIREKETLARALLVSSLPLPPFFPYDSDEKRCRC